MLTISTKDNFNYKKDIFLFKDNLYCPNYYISFNDDITPFILCSNISDDIEEYRKIINKCITILRNFKDLKKEHEIKKSIEKSLNEIDNVNYLLKSQNNEIELGSFDDTLHSYESFSDDNDLINYLIRNKINEIQQEDE